MDINFTSIAVGAGFLLTGWAVKSFLIPFYVKHVSNQKIYDLVFKAALKADEYADSKLGKSNSDPLQNTLAATGMAAALAACDGTGIDADAMLQVAKALRHPLTINDPKATE